MSKRYAYYRMPNGNPNKNNETKYVPERVLAEIGETATIKEDNSMSWPAFSFQKLRITLEPCIVILDADGNELNDTDAWQIIWQAIKASVKSSPGKPIVSSTLLHSIDVLAADFFRKIPNKYLLLTSLSIGDLPAKRIKMLGCEISSLKTRGRKFPLPEILDRLEKGCPLSKHIGASEYRLVKITTNGRTKNEAVDNALRSLALLRGLWSLYATYGSWSMRFGNSPTRRPIGVIHSGPIHTLHLTSGALADDNLYWYEPDFIEEQPIFQPPKGWQALDKKRQWAVRQLTKLEYRQDVEALLIRYVDALDQSNPSVALLKMWGLLEKITNTIGSNYDETIERVVWLFSGNDRILAKNMLQSLRLRRNQYVHFGNSGHETDQAMYMIKYFVDPHLWRLIANPLMVKSIAEYGEILSLPANKSTLEERQRRLKIALQFLGVSVGTN